MRQLQAASHVFFWRRWAAAAAAACPTKRTCSTQLGQLPRASGGFCAPSSSPRAPAPAPAPALPPPPASEPTTTATRPVAAAAAAAPTTSAEAYFRSLLRSRGRSVAATRLAFRQPTPKQVHDYGLKPFVSDLARKGDIEGLQKAMEAGRGMDASNKFGESVVHIACRRGNLDVLRFLVANGGSLTVCDDLGRFPLHEVCWAARPRFDIVRVFLEEERRSNARRHRRRQAGGGGAEGGGSGAEAEADRNSSSDELAMLLLADKRGCSPLRYVKPESWPLWHRFFDEVADEYWPSVLPPQ